MKILKVLFLLLAPLSLLEAGWDAEKIIKVMEFPDDPQSIGPTGEYVDAGYIYKQTIIFFVPVWNYDGRWAGYIESDTDYIEWDRIELEEIAKSSGLKLPDSPSLPSWDSIGGKLVFMLIVLLYVATLLSSTEEIEEIEEIDASKNKSKFNLPININIILVLLAIFIMASSVVIQNSDVVIQNTGKEEGCYFLDAKGKEFVFREQSPSLQEYGYPTWIKSTDLSSEGLSYKAYVGKHAKLKEEAVSAGSFEWFVAITETCEIIYNVKLYPDEQSGEVQGPVDILESYTGVYFLETLEKAKTLVGKEVWAKIPSESEASHLLFTPDPGIRYPRNYLQKLYVIDIDTYQYDHTFDAAPFSLIVKTETGEEVLLPYSSREFYETYPVSVN